MGCVAELNSKGLMDFRISLFYLPGKSGFKDSSELKNLLSVKQLKYTVFERIARFFVWSSFLINVYFPSICFYYMQDNICNMGKTKSTVWHGSKFRPTFKQNKNVTFSNTCTTIFYTKVNGHFYEERKFFLFIT